jgi:hypothetical protein
MKIKTKLVLGFIGFCVLLALAQPKKAEQNTQIAQFQPEPTPELQKPKPTPSASPTPTPIAQATSWHEQLCVGDKYWASNGVSIAQRTACQYIISKALKPETVVIASTANNDDIADQMVGKGFKKVSWRDEYNPLTSSENACIYYKDNSVSCHKNSDTLIVASESEEEAFPQWDSSSCSEPNPSIGQRTACQYLQVGSLQPQDIIYVGEKEDEAVEILKTSGYEVYSDWRSFDPISDRSISACIPYKDNSVTCYKKASQENKT